MIGIELESLNRIQLVALLGDAEEAFDKALATARMAEIDKTLTDEMLDEIEEIGDLCFKIHQALMHLLACSMSEKLHLVKGAKNLKGQ
jgi:hypothetical protein